MITFCFYCKVNQIVNLLKLPYCVEYLSKRFRNTEIPFCYWKNDTLVVEVVNFIARGTIAGLRAWKIKIMANIHIIYPLIVLLTTYLMIDFRLLRRKYSQAWDTLHLRLPFLKIWVVIELVYDPVEYHYLAAFKLVKLF